MNKNIILFVSLALIGVGCKETTLINNDITSTCGNGKADAGEVCFSEPTTLDAGSAPKAVAVGDLNKDGSPDIVVANSGSDNVTILLGKGDGTFDPPTTADVGNEPVFVIVEDLNGDGNPDVLTSNKGSNNISILFGNGDGTVDPPLDISTGNAPLACAVGLINGDNFPDIVCANSGSNTLTLLLNNGAGGFAPPPSRIPTPIMVGSNPQFLMLNDVNGDGKLDVLTVNKDSNNVSVLLGNGNTFDAQNTIDVGEQPLSLTMGDIDGDSIPDFVTANSGSKNLSVLVGVGDGTFRPPVGSEIDVNPPEEIDVNPPESIDINPPEVVALSDVNGDGVLDVIASLSVANDIVVLSGKGAGGFQSAFGLPSAGNTQGLGAFALADLNGDASLDIVTANSGSNNLSLFLSAH